MSSCSERGRNHHRQMGLQETEFSREFVKGYEMTMLSVLGSPGPGGKFTEDWRAT